MLVIIVFPFRLVSFFISLCSTICAFMPVMSAIAAPFLGKSMIISVLFLFTCCTFFPVFVLIAFLFKSVLAFILLLMTNIAFFPVLALTAFLLKSVSAFILLLMTNTAFMPMISVIIVPCFGKSMSCCFYSLLFRFSTYSTFESFTPFCCTCWLCCVDSIIPCMLNRNFFILLSGIVFGYLVSFSHCITFDGDVL